MDFVKCLELLVRLMLYKSDIIIIIIMIIITICLKKNLL